jgi:MraZ protein
VEKSARKWNFWSWGGKVFQGSTNVSIDAKGRIAIPSRHRDLLLELGGKLTLTAHPEGSLLLYRDPEWIPVRERVNALPSTHRASRGLQLVMLGMAESMELDTSGRMLIPPTLRKHAKFDKEITLLGVGNRFELWDTATFDRMKEELPAQMSAADIPQALRDFSL